MGRTCSYFFYNIQIIFSFKIIDFNSEALDNGCARHKHALCACMIAPQGDRNNPLNYMRISLFLLRKNNNKHACARHKIITLWVNTVTPRVTIKRFALACLCKAQNSFPLRNHGKPNAFFKILLDFKILISDHEALRA